MKRGDSCQNLSKLSESRSGCFISTAAQKQIQQLVPAMHKVSVFCSSSIIFIKVGGAEMWLVLWVGGADRK